jgi:hypothetical protein
MSAKRGDVGVGQRRESDVAAAWQRAGRVRLLLFVFVVRGLLLELEEFAQAT